MLRKGSVTQPVGGGFAGGEGGVPLVPLDPLDPSDPELLLVDPELLAPLDPPVGSDNV